MSGLEIVGVGYEHQGRRCKTCRSRAGGGGRENTTVALGSGGERVAFVLPQGIFIVRKVTSRNIPSCRQWGAVTISSGKLDIDGFALHHAMGRVGTIALRGDQAFKSGL